MTTYLAQTDEEVHKETLANMYTDKVRRAEKKEITYLDPLECHGYLAYDAENRVVACEPTYGDAKLEARYLGVRCPMVVHSDVIKRAHRGLSI